MDDPPPYGRRSSGPPHLTSLSHRAGPPDQEATQKDLTHLRRRAPSDQGGGRPPEQEPPPPRPAVAQATMFESGIDPRGPGGGGRRKAVALEYLYEHYNRYVLKTLGRFGVRGSDDRSELAMQVWLVAFKDYEDYRGQAQFLSWLSQICRRVASDHRHSAWARRVQLASDPESAPHDTAVAARDEEGILDSLSVLERLPPLLRDVVILYYVEEMTAKDIADRLSKPPREVYSLVERALKCIEAEL